jgi:hypothetical protein
VLPPERSGAPKCPSPPYLNGERLDLETKRVLGVALELVCIALRTGDCDDSVKQAIATKLIELAKAGERNPDLLCEQALKDIVGRKFRPYPNPLRPWRGGGTSGFFISRQSVERPDR